MINFKKALGGMVVGLSLLAGAAGVNAACTASGKVQQLWTFTYDNSLTGGSYTYVIVAPLGGLFGGPATFWSYGYTYADKVTNTMAGAHSGNDTVVVTGDAASCPTSGTFRFIGQITDAASAKNF
jgi:hypothetical protein